MSCLGSFVDFIPGFTFQMPATAGVRPNPIQSSSPGRVAGTHLLKLSPVASLAVCKQKDDMENSNPGTPVNRTLSLITIIVIC